MIGVDQLKFLIDSCFLVRASKLACKVLFTCDLPLFDEADTECFINYYHE